MGGLLFGREGGSCSGGEVKKMILIQSKGKFSLSKKKKRYNLTAKNKNRKKLGKGWWRKSPLPKQIPEESSSPTKRKGEEAYKIKAT